MQNIQIMTDSSADLAPDMISKNDIAVVPFYITFDGNTYLKENVELQPKEFYDKLITVDANPKTSCPSIDDYYTAFKTAVEDNKAIICFTITSKFSGSYQSANNAKNMILEDYPNANIAIVDSMSATGGQALLVLEACKMYNDGLDFGEIVERSKVLATTSCVYFTVDDLRFLERGGRIGKAASLAGKLLNIKPILKVFDGELLPEAKVRGRKKAISEVEGLTAKNTKATKEFVFVKMNFQENPNAELLDLSEDSSYIKINLGATIGVHTGPTAVGLAFMRRYNTVYIDKLVQREEKLEIKESKRLEKIEKKIEKLESKKEKLNK